MEIFARCKGRGWDAWDNEVSEEKQPQRQLNQRPPANRLNFHIAVTAGCGGGYGRD